MGSLPAHVVGKVLWKSNVLLNTAATLSHRPVRMRAVAALSFIDGALHRNQTHQYYSQVQMQMFVSGSTFCDFVVWSLKDCAVVWISPNLTYWKTLLAKARDFFFKVCLPELVACHYTC
ncbi:hypothetical protein AMECASPLE_036454, partial [Ameca splendens]